MSTTSGLTGPPQPPPRSGHQDLAPPSGYKPINVARRVPKSVGPSASLLLVGGGLVIAWGFYRVGTFNVYRRCVTETDQDSESLIIVFTHLVSKLDNALSFEVCRELKQEKKEIRTAILPLLQAEEDAKFVRETKKANDWEGEVMKDVPGWIPGENVYKTRNFMPPSSSTAPSTSR